MLNINLLSVSQIICITFTRHFQNQVKRANTSIAKNLMFLEALGLPVHNEKERCRAYSWNNNRPAHV